MAWPAKSAQEPRTATATSRRQSLAFVVWCHHSRRAESLAAELNVAVSFIHESRLRGHWLTPLRYLLQSWQTWRLLERERPDAVIVQMPPIVAPLVVAIWCEVRGRLGSSRRRLSYVIDCHTGAFYGRRWAWALPLLRLLARRATVTLTTDPASETIFTRWGIQGFFLPDRVPTLPAPSSDIGTAGAARIAVISTFERGDPIAEVFGAARLLPEVMFYLTGDPALAPSGLLARKPANVILTGFLRGGAYTALLSNVHGLAILTKRPDDMSAGAYEAVAVAQPALISDWPQMRRYYNHGFVYVKNMPGDIAAGVTTLLSERERLVNEIRAMGADLTARRLPRFRQLAVLLEAGT